MRSSAQKRFTAVGRLDLFGLAIDTPVRKYLLVLAIVVVLALAATHLTRGRIGRMWMAMRDMDIAAEIIGIRPLQAKLSAFAVSSFYIGVAGALWGFVRLGSWEPLAFDVGRSFQVHMLGRDRIHTFPSQRLEPDPSRVGAA